MGARLVEKAIVYVDANGAVVSAAGGGAYTAPQSTPYETRGKAIAAAKATRERMKSAGVDNERAALGVVAAVPIYDVYEDAVQVGTIRADGQFVEL